MDSIMTSKSEKVCEVQIKECVRCGYCCKVSPCKYGHKPEKPDESTNNYCIYLLVDDCEIGTYKCEIWDWIKYVLEEDALYPMCGSGCSSTLFNTDREMVLKIMAEMAAERLLGEITYENH